MASKKNIPEIRFKGFSGEWEEKELGKIINISSAARVHKEEWKESGIPFFRSSDVVAAYKGEPNSKAFISKELYYQLVEISGCLHKNDILVTGGGSIGIPFLIASESPLYFKDADLLWFKNNQEMISRFLYFYLTTSIFKTYIKSITHIGTISHYTIEQAKATPIQFPSIEEQLEIGAFFQNLDALIAQRQQKLDKLSSLKKAMLDKMFPKDGADEPELRFKGCTGKWELKKVKELFSVTRGYVLAFTKTSDKKTKENPYPVYSSQTRNDGLMGYYKEYLFNSAITWTTDGANAGTVNFRPNKFYCTNVCGVLLSSVGYANQMVSEVLNKVAWKHVSKVGNSKLMNNVMSEISIIVPSVLEEQNKISILLKNLDSLISLQKRELDKLKNMKKACLQKMFV